MKVQWQVTSIQSALEKIVPSLKADGFYILTHEVAARDFDTCRVHGFLGDFDDHLNGYRHALNNHVFLFETGFSSPEASLTRMKSDNGVVAGEYVQASTEEERVRLLQSLHEGIRSFAEDVKDRLGPYLDTVTISPTIAESQLLRFADHPSADDARAFIGCEVENAFGGGSTYLIQPHTSKARIDPDQLISRSSWKAGAKAVYVAPCESKVAKPIVKQQILPSWPQKPNQSTERATTSREVVKVAPQPSSGTRSRKRAKLVKNPYLFFHDARIPHLKRLKHLFGPHWLGNTNTRVLRTLMKALG